MDENGRPLVSGRHVTGFSNMEEKLSGLKSQVPFLLEDELKARGALYRRSGLSFAPFIVTDGRIVTGQNPGSSKAVAVAVIKILSDEQSH